MRVRARTEGMNRTQRYFSGMRRRSRDFRTIFRWAQQELEDAFTDNFKNRGASAGNPWPPLTSEYSTWKLEHYGPLPTLIREGDLYQSLRFLNGPPNDIGRTQATFGTDLPYAKFHETGTKYMAQRRIMFVPKLFTETIAKAAGAYVIRDVAPDLSVPTLRSLFTT